MDKRGSNQRKLCSVSFENHPTLLILQSPNSFVFLLRPLSDHSQVTDISEHIFKHSVKRLG